MKKQTTFVNSIVILSSLLLFLLLSATTCKRDSLCPDGSHDIIEIKNNSSKTINWRQFISDSIYTINGSTAAADLVINANSSDNYGIRNCWEETFRDGYTPYFLIFDNDTVQAIGWQAISGTDRGLLKRIKVDLNYLNKNNFTISYP
jgi:hypothetical protein